MNENHNNINRYTSSPVNEMEKVEAPECELKIEKYQSLLFEIGDNFGFTDKETSIMVEEVYSYASRHYKDETNCLPLRILLSKAMVHKCIFKVSCRMFNENTLTAVKPSCYSNNTSFEARRKEMPLSYLTVYILNNVIGFSDAEIASILNTTTFQVRERLRKALMITKNNP